MESDLDKLKLMVKTSMKVLIYIDYRGVVKKENQIVRAINATSSQVCKIVLRFEKEKLVNVERKGRVSQITLTEKGKRISENLKKINQIMIK